MPIRLAAAAMLADQPRAGVEHFLSLGYPGYWLSFDPESHARHAAMIREAEASGPDRRRWSGAQLRAAVGL